MNQEIILVQIVGHRVRPISLPTCFRFDELRQNVLLLPVRIVHFFKTQLLLTLTDPDWASSTMGLFICISCSGIHRNLGIQISVVKSLRLDTWTDSKLQVCILFSRNVNSISEFRMLSKPGFVFTSVVLRHEIFYSKINISIQVI